MVKSPFQKSFPAAIAFFKSKIGLPSENWKTISEEYSAIAFTIAGITKTAILKDVSDAIAQQLESGISPEQFRATFKDILTRRGWNPEFSPYRINLILSQNIRTAINYSRFEQLTDPSTLKPYWQWQWRDSVKPREHHKAQDGKVFPANDPCFKAIMPQPFSCRCTVYALSQRQLDKQGLKVSKPPKLSAIAEPGFSTGFPANLSEQRQQLIERAIASLPPNLAALLQEEIELSESLDFYDPRQPRNKDGKFASKSFGGSVLGKQIDIESRLRKQKEKALKELRPNWKYDLDTFERVYPDTIDKLLIEYTEQKKAVSAQKREQKKLRSVRDEQVLASRSSFDNPPDVIKNAIAVYGYPEMDLPIAGEGAHFHPGTKKIHMDSIAKDDPSFDSIYAHEYGHYLDGALASKGSNHISSSPKGKEAFEKDAARLRAKIYNKAVEPLSYDQDYLNLRDMAGALTKNRLGGGHSKEYWDLPEKRETEVFANIVSLIAKNNPKYDAAVKEIAPNTYNFVMETLKNVKPRNNAS